MSTGLFLNHQDRITDSVWITRAEIRGIYNIRIEDEYDRVSFDSPKGTEWAIGRIADGIENLTFTTWLGSNPNGPPASVGQDKVLHLIAEDIYIDVRFTAWTEGVLGSQDITDGAFTYIRSTPDLTIDQDEDGFFAGEDCDDDNAFVNPDQTEIPYNGLDDDCNPATRDDDLDQDGFILAEDCDDTDPNLNPGIAEIPYNELDDDCNPATPDDDVDQDGFLKADDCDDNRADINPNQVEIPYNGVDDDCDPMTLDDDLDQDGFILEQDCNDNRADINPAQTEIPYNGVDDDCDPMTLDDDLDQDGFILEQDCNDNPRGHQSGTNRNTLQRSR